MLFMAFVRLSVCLFAGSMHVSPTSLFAFSVQYFCSHLFPSCLCIFCSSRDVDVVVAAGGVIVAVALVDAATIVFVVHITAFLVTAVDAIGVTLAIVILEFPKDNFCRLLSFHFPFIYFFFNLIFLSF